MQKYTKHPRTWHVPQSPGATSDDKRLKSLDQFKNKQVVVTKKMDGECTKMYNDHIHARSIDSKNHPSRNWVKGLHAAISNMMPEELEITGENLYAQHSVAYTDLPSYFLVFQMVKEGIVIPWEGTEYICKLLGLSTVPVLYQGIYYDGLIDEYVDQLDLTKDEGVVIRLADSFLVSEFSNCVAKWVRPGHVQTDEHWMQKEVVKNQLKPVDTEQ